MLIETLFELFRVKGSFKEHSCPGIVHRFTLLIAMFIITEEHPVTFIIELLNARVTSHAGTGALKILISP